MGKAKLTFRQKKLIRILLPYTIEEPATIGLLSEKLGVSTRTILREIPAVEEWLEENGFQLQKRPGFGIALEETLESRQYLSELLDFEEGEKTFHKEERQKRIITELLFAKGPIKSKYFLKTFHISEGTFANDLEEIEKWFQKFDIVLRRRQGVGIQAEGSESKQRQAISNLLLDSLNEKEMIKLLSGEGEETGNDPVEKRLLGFIEKQTIVNIEKILSETELEFGVQYVDSAFIALMVHIALMLKRIEYGEKIVMEQAVFEQLTDLPEFSVAKRVAEKLQEQFLLEIPIQEIGYITMHMRGGRLKTARNTAAALELTNMQLIDEMVSIVEQELHIKIRRSNKLYEDLLNHVEPAVHRLTLGIKMRNSQLKEIQQNYPEIYQATEKACAVLKQIDGVKQISEDEIAFIAIHFGAIIEMERAYTQIVKVVIVCPTGIGTSKLLAVKIEQSFQNIHVIEVISAIHINVERLKQKGIDFIISTVELPSVAYPNICVSPMLREEDVMLLKDMVKQALLTPKIEVKEEIAQKPALSEKIGNIQAIGSQILKLLADVKIVEYQTLKNVQSTIVEAARLFAPTKEIQQVFIEQFSIRERQSDLYVKELHMLLLHCKSELLTDGPKFGAIRLQYPFLAKGKVILGAVVLMIPDGCEKWMREMLSEISGAFISRKEFAEAIQKKPYKEIMEILEEIMEHFFDQMMRESLKK